MPIYEYRCKSCGHIFESLVMKKSDKKPPCPACNKKNSERVISTVSIGNKNSIGCAPGAPSGFS